jgi:hypothetical protein
MALHWCGCGAHCEPTNVWWARRSGAPLVCCAGRGLVAAVAQVVACVHVPGHYLSSGVPRYAYLRKLEQEGRLVILFGLPRAATGRRCAWLLVFRSAALKQRLLRPGLRTVGLCFN